MLSRKSVDIFFNLSEYKRKKERERDREIKIDLRGRVCVCMCGYRNFNEFFIETKQQGTKSKSPYAIFDKLIIPIFWINCLN